MKKLGKNLELGDVVLYGETSNRITTVCGVTADRVDFSNTDFLWLDRESYRNSVWEVIDVPMLIRHKQELTAALLEAQDKIEKMIVSEERLRETVASAELIAENEHLRENCFTLRGRNNELENNINLLKVSLHVDQQSLYDTVESLQKLIASRAGECDRLNREILRLKEQLLGKNRR